MRFAMKCEIMEATVGKQKATAVVAISINRTLMGCSFSGTTDFQVRRFPYGRAWKSVVPPLPNNDFIKSTAR
ncbi:MAG: hypothetical protein K9M08_21210 [Pirellula sp.]|nr:hypothetical protein [Pirellula sp.]